MKQFNLFSLLIMVLSISFANAQTATWNGSVSQSWNNPQNWTWTSGGSGIPGAAHDVIVTDEFSMPNVLNGLRLMPGDSVSCKNLYFLGDTASNPIILVLGNAKLNIYGNTISGMPVGGDTLSGNLMAEDMTSQINFFGPKTTISKTFIQFGTVNLYNHDVYLNNSILIIGSKLYFNGAPAPIGTPVSGNLIAERGVVAFNKSATFDFFPYSDTQIPPHIITTGSMDFMNFGNIVAVANIIDIANPSTSSVFTFPVGPSNKAFTPITIQNNDTLDWFVSVSKNLPTACSNSAQFNPLAVQYKYEIAALDSNENFVTSTQLPLQIKLTHNASNVGEDVLPMPLLNYKLKMFHLNDATQCPEDLNVDTTNFGGYVTLTKKNVNKLGTFLLKYEPNSSVKTLAEDISLSLYPNPTTANINLKIDKTHKVLTLKISDVTGRIVHTQVYPANAFNTAKSIDLKSFSKGMYFLNLSNEDINFSTKITKY